MTPWEIAATIVVPLLGVLSGLLGAKWRKGMRLLKETSEAVVALGLCGLRLQKALEDPSTAAGERDEVTRSVKRVGMEFSQAIAAAADVFNRAQ